MTITPALPTPVDFKIMGAVIFTNMFVHPQEYKVSDHGDARPGDGFKASTKNDATVQTLVFDAFVLLLLLLYRPCCQNPRGPRYLDAGG